MSEEIHPYLVYRITGDRLECTVWKLQEGEKAVALFQTVDGAAAYHKGTNLGPEWKVIQPGKEALIQILSACYQAGIRYAVLDPDLKEAKRIFDLGRVLQEAMAPPAPQ